MSFTGKTLSADAVRAYLQAKKDEERAKQATHEASARR